MKILGYAVVFDSWSVDLGGFVERIRPGAFRRTLSDGHPIFAVHTHNFADLLGSTQGGTLALREDGRGLRFELELPDTGLGRDVHTLVRRGDLTAMSFSFRVHGSRGEDWREGKNGRIERELLDLELFEVSTVALPAYPATSVQARAEVVDARRNRMLRRTMNARLAAVAA